MVSILKRDLQQNTQLLEDSYAGMYNSVVQSIRPSQCSSDLFSRTKTSTIQNIYSADFEYGKQSGRWEELTGGSGVIIHRPDLGGTEMRITGAVGDRTIRQTRPYMRYQAGKTMTMATAAFFGTANPNQVQRVGFFDDGNGCFFEQATPTQTNPAGMFVVVRSDTSGVPTDYIRIALPDWNGSRDIINKIDFINSIQMLAVDYAWYGAGSVRFSIYIEGIQHILHTCAFGNSAFGIGGVKVIGPWCRTGNLPVRFEQRNTGASVANSMFHYGVSINVDGRVDDQRGFTYSYGSPNTTPTKSLTSGSIRVPVLSLRGRANGTQEFTNSGATVTGGTNNTITVAGTPWVTNQWLGRSVFFPNAPLPAISSAVNASGTTGTITFSSPHGLPEFGLLTISGATPSGWNRPFNFVRVNATTVTVTFLSNVGTASPVGTATAPFMGRITGNTANTLTFTGQANDGDWLTAFGSGAAYTIGLVNRGQLLPLFMELSATASAANTVVSVEVFASTPQNPIALVGASFTPMNTVGAALSFAERDVAASSFTGGEFVLAFTLPSSGAGLIQKDLFRLFPILNTIRGNLPDILTVCVTNSSGATVNVGCHVTCQEEMS